MVVCVRQRSCLHHNTNIHLSQPNDNSILVSVSDQAAPMASRILCPHSFYITCVLWLKFSHSHRINIWMGLKRIVCSSIHPAGGETKDFTLIALAKYGEIVYYSYYTKSASVWAVCGCVCVCGGLVCECASLCMCDDAMMLLVVRYLLFCFWMATLNGFLLSNLRIVPSTYISIIL